MPVEGAAVAPPPSGWLVQFYCQYVLSTALVASAQCGLLQALRRAGAAGVSLPCVAHSIRGAWGSRTSPVVRALLNSLVSAHIVSYDGHSATYSLRNELAEGLVNAGYAQPQACIHFTQASKPNFCYPPPLVGGGVTLAPTQYPPPPPPYPPPL